jgi:hypothetical protein
MYGELIEKSEVIEGEKERRSYLQQRVTTYHLALESSVGLFPTISFGRVILKDYSLRELAVF